MQTKKDVRTNIYKEREEEWKGKEGKGRKDETQQTKEKGKGVVVDIIIVLLLPSHLSVPCDLGEDWEGFLGLD